MSYIFYFLWTVEFLILKFYVFFFSNFQAKSANFFILNILTKSVILCDASFWAEITSTTKFWNFLKTNLKNILNDRTVANLWLIDYKKQIPRVLRSRNYVF